MADKTGIEWTDATWNPIRGCSKVSEGCRNCYAMHVAARFSNPGQAYEGLAKRDPARWSGQVRFIEEHLEDPLRWKRPRRIFVNSMSDLFHEGLSDDQIDRVFIVMALAHWHTFQVVTKRAHRMREYLDELYAGRMYELAEKAGAAGPAVLAAFANQLPNVWFIVSVEDQDTADDRIPQLLQTQATVKGISAEPLLGPLDISIYLATGYDEPPYDDILNWVIVGGESGPGARPMHPDWARSLRDQCVAAGVPFFFKQWGEWAPYGDSVVNGFCGSDAMKWDHFPSPFAEDRNTPAGRPAEGVRVKRNAETTIVGVGPAHVKQREMVRVGKKKAGRALDGRIWDEYPEVAA